MVSWLEGSFLDRDKTRKGENGSGLEKKGGFKVPQVTIHLAKVYDQALWTAVHNTFST